MEIFVDVAAADVAVIRDLSMIVAAIPVSVVAVAVVVVVAVANLSHAVAIVFDQRYNLRRFSSAIPSVSSFPASVSSTMPTFSRPEASFSHQLPSI